MSLHVSANRVGDGLYVNPRVRHVESRTRHAKRRIVRLTRYMNTLYLGENGGLLL